MKTNSNQNFIPIALASTCVPPDCGQRFTI